jgi:hypothetical protein
MAADFRDASEKTVDVIADSNGGLVEHHEDLGVVAERNPAIHNAKTHLTLVFKCIECIDAAILREGSASA